MEKVSTPYLVRRMMHTKRWTIINTARPQTIAEHTCGVMMLLDSEATDAGLSAEQHLALLRHALYHDAFEVVSGDMPGSFKRNNAEVKSAISKAEEAASWVPSAECPPELKHLMRAADLAESVIYLDDAGIGRRARRVTETLRAMVESTGFSHLFFETNKLNDDEDLGNH
jgi:5'-deoxynucleotidase YfbR-like HD superfamily hydrolase